MKKLIGSIFVLTSCVWGQAVSPTINPFPTRQFGHPALVTPLTQASPNLVEGRELAAPGQIAFDTSVSPPILYIADIGNNRVLAFKNSASLTAGNFADLVIGQQDFVSTLAQGGAASTLTTGLSSPTGVAVDGKGNLYVADAGNNRILRFPSPFKQQAGITPIPDLVIGQKSFSSGTTYNEGTNCSSKTLALSGGGSVYVTSLAMDPSGNLWVTDPLNYRVLMYPSAANIAANTVEQTAAVVLGQTDFVTCSPPNTNVAIPQLIKNGLIQPASLAFDNNGNLYVADSYSRVLYYTGPTFTVGQSAVRVLGLSPPQQQGQQPVTFPNQYSLGAPNASGNLVPPNGVFTQGNHLFVADTPSNRIVEYDIPGNWSAETTTIPSPQILKVTGQIGFTTGKANQGLAQPNSSTLSGPYAGAFAGTQMWVADTGNNRILAYNVDVTGSYTAASAVVGQTAYIYTAPNLIEGKEVFFSGAGTVASAGIVVDKNSSPPHLYVADPGNNRILCFNDARKVGGNATATFADLIIGQPDSKTSEINYPNGQVGSPTQTGLYNPTGVAVDNNGNLYVADYGNGRVVRFPAPFNQTGQPTANLVLGQATFTSLIQNATQNSMHSPFGVALFAGSDANATPLAGPIAVSDPIFNRVLFFKKAAGGDFSNGQNAYLVIGQSSYSAVSLGTGSGSFNQPHGIGADTSDRLYVADTQNGRVQAFEQAPQFLSNGPTATQTYTNLNQPFGVALSSITTELWVANTGGSQVVRYPEYNHCALISCAATAFLSPGAFPLGLALDATDNVIVGDNANRVTFFFAQAFFRNAANFNIEGLAPGGLAILGRLGLPMSIHDGAATTSTWPTTLADLNVTVNGTLAPIFATNAAYGAISLQVPYEAPTSGTANFIITQNSTGSVLGVGAFQMAKSNPGFFTVTQDGLGQVVALNLDGTNTRNGPGNAIARGGNIEFCLTGLGQVPGAPPDGQPPSVAVAAPAQPLLVIGGTQLTSDQIGYSGLGCGFAGGWQINATVPLAVAPGTAVVALIYNGVKSNLGGTTASDGISPGQDRQIVTSITVK